MTCIETRVEDLKSIDQEKTTVRLFCGDNPARQFEAGQQRGGNYSCLCGIHSKDHQNLEGSFVRETLTLEDRKLQCVKGRLWKRVEEDGITNPYKNLRKDDLIDELEGRGIDTSDMKKADLEEELEELIHGIIRPPALMIGNSTNTILPILQQYEIPPCEPLHDITNVVLNLVTELPYHVDTKVKCDFEKFAKETVSDKTQLKGSDARLYIIKLNMFVHKMLENNKVSKDVVNMVDALVDIISTAYTPYNNRTPRLILRLFNQCFIFAVLCKSVIGIPKKMTPRKFYGTHWHTLVTHFPETQRIFNLRSVLVEKEERSFGTLRSISLSTTNRRAENVVDNAILRFNAQQKDGMKEDSFQRQDTSIRHQAKLLPPRPNSSFTKQQIAYRPYLFQCHMQRVADFMEPGEGVWWKSHQNRVEFLDGPDEAEFKDAGPQLHYFRSSNLKLEQRAVKDCWQHLIQKYKEDSSCLPLPRLKIYNSQGKSMIVEGNSF